MFSYLTWCHTLTAFTSLPSVGAFPLPSQVSEGSYPNPEREESDFYHYFQFPISHSTGPCSQLRYWLRWAMSKDTDAGTHSCWSWADTCESGAGHSASPRWSLTVQGSEMLWRHWNRLPRELWMPHPWRCLRPHWMEPWSTGYGGCSRGFGTRWSLRFLSTQAILYDSVIKQ